MFTASPWNVPTPDGVQRPLSMQLDVYLPADANYADQQQLTPIAQAIVSHNSSQMQRWIDANRQFVSVSGGRQFQQRRLNMPGMNAIWSYNNGQEKLLMSVYPHQVGGRGSQTADTNLDGYIVWIHADPYWPNINGLNRVGSPGPYLIAMNGYIIEDAFEITSNCIGYPILFGRTALLCASYAGDAEKLNPLLPNQSLKKPNRVIPPPGDYIEGTAPDGTAQSAIQKTFGYWVFDWSNPHNPFQYLNYYGWYNWKNFWTSQSAPLGIPVLSKGTYFASSQPGDSPLNSRGNNGVSALALSQFAEEIPIFNMFYGEFYDRGKYRRVSQSWVVPASPGRSVLVNDSPILFAQASYVFDYQGDDGGGLSFDLSSGSTGQGSAGDDNIIDIHGGVQVGLGGGLLGLTPDQTTVVDDWLAQIVQINNATQALDTVLVNQGMDAWAAKWGTAANQKLLNEAQNVRTALTDMSDANGNYTPVTYGDGPVTVYDDAGTAYYGPTQQYWFEWDNTYNGNLMGTYPLYFGIANRGGGATFYTNNPPLLSAGDTTANGGTPMTYQEFYTWATNYVQTDAVAQREADYNAIYTNLPTPQYPPFPVVSGGDITKFKYSRIVINGNSWEYQQ